MIRVSTILLVSLALISCAPSTPRLAVSLPPLPPNIAAPCPEPPLLASGTLGEVVTVLVDLAAAYRDCAARHAGAVAAYRAAETATGDR